MKKKRVVLLAEGHNGESVTIGGDVSESRSNDLLSVDNIERVLWELSELHNSEPENIESNDLEIMGEDEQGRDGYCTVQITEVAGRAIELIQALKSR